MTAKIESTQTISAPLTIPQTASLLLFFRISMVDILL